ncbi:MAG: futalosine hydrolase [Phycisphaerae bacterium]|nr:futalosine hydrolase [Phycisphaerae bacterium]|tara:strand:+ start:1195 stop:1824 length:630 start_codon:yes stop_codon:yes gene_type:complete
MRALIITAVQAEAEAIGQLSDTTVVAGGVGRTNAAASTTRCLLEDGPFSMVISAGIAGILPGNDLEVGDVLLANECVYMEEGIETPEGFQDLDAMGFPLGEFRGNHVPVDGPLLEKCPAHLPRGPIATVATCSGTDELASLVEKRTGAMAEAMEGAAVLHAAGLLGVPGLEIRSMSNFTGHRSAQQWDIPKALESLRNTVEAIVSSFKD